MKYIIRLIVLPLYASCWLIFALYITLGGLFKLCYDFIVYGGEQIIHNKHTNKDSILAVYKKLEEMEASFKIDPRSKCNHVWETERYNGTTTAPKTKCVICGTEVNNANF